MRLSSIQKDSLVVLLLLQGRQGNNKTPIYGVDILNILNDSRVSSIHANNFRRSMHTLKYYKFIDQTRDPSLRLAYRLTELGESAAKERLNRLKTLNQP